MPKARKAAPYQPENQQNSPMEEEEKRKRKKEKEGVGGPAHQPTHIVLPLATLGCLSPPPFSCCCPRLSRRRRRRFGRCRQRFGCRRPRFGLRFSLRRPGFGLRRSRFGAATPKRRRPFPSALCPLADSYLGDGDTLDLSAAWTPRRRL
jgi:hypothetical protein